MTTWEQGLQAFRQGRLHEALDRLRDAALETERTVLLEVRFKTLCHLGAAQYALGHPTDAVSTFEEAVKFSPSPTPPLDLLVNLANAYMAAGRSDDARGALQTALLEAPGHLEAQMLFRRLDRSSSSAPSSSAPSSGAMLGEHPDSVRRYLDTLSFSRTPDGGLEPDQVQLAIIHVGHYLDQLVEQIVARDETIARQETEIAFVQHQMIAMNQKQQQNQPEDTGQMTPLEVLFQKKYDN